MPYKTIIDNLKDNHRLSLKDCSMGDADVKSLAQALKGSEITKLDLSNNHIGCIGLKDLVQALRETEITKLNLENNNIMDEGAKYLAEYLKDTRITDLDLRQNKIGFQSALCLNEMLSSSKVISFNLYIDIHYTYEGDNNKLISQRTYYFHADNRPTSTYITLHNNTIGIEGAQYLNKTFKHIAIDDLTLHGQTLEANDVIYLAKAFKDTKINKLNLSYNHIMQPNGIKYLIQAFKYSQIAQLYLDGEKIGNRGARYLAEFLKEVKVIDLDIRLNEIGDEGMKYLAPAFKNSDIMYLNLAWNDIKPEGARCLSKILKNSKIISIDLCNDSIGADGARYLADGLPGSQVTSIHLHGNRIEYVGYQYLIAVIDKTNISWVNLHRNNIEEGLEEGTTLWPYSIPRNTTPIAYDVRHIFENLVSLNPKSNEFEFIIPRKKTYPPVNMDQYAFLFRTLNENPNSKVHIFDLMCNKRIYFDLDVMNKINEFIAVMPNIFNKFIDSNLPDLIQIFDDYNSYVNLVKQFEDMKMYSIVQNLLLHRLLYYVDENQEFLHPYIYKLLHKYSMPLYNEQLEPNKKEEIISYYQSNQKFDGVQEIIDLLRSESFK